MKMEAKRTLPRKEEKAIVPLSFLIRRGNLGWSVKMLFLSFYELELEREKEKKKNGNNIWKLEISFADNWVSLCPTWPVGPHVPDKMSATSKNTLFL